MSTPDLERAAELHKAGALTDEEYERVRSRVVAAHESAKEAPEARPVQCPTCQKEYDATYKHCPYCAADRALRRDVGASQGVTAGSGTGATHVTAGQYARVAGGCAGKVVLLIVVSIIVVNLFMCALLNSLNL